MNESKLTVTKLADHFWQINESADLGQGLEPYVDAFLIAGDRKALLIDSLMQSRSLLETVRQLTDLPVEVVLTHGHGDHAGKSLEDFAAARWPVHLHPDDHPLLKNLFELDYPKSWFSDAFEGQTFCLGGCQLTVHLVPGHSPGSLVVLDKENGRLFCGDSLGSGTVWMHIPYTLSLADYKKSLQKLNRHLAGMENLQFFPGHRNQAPSPMTRQYLDDLMHLVDSILSGQKKGRPIRSKAGDHEFSGRTARHGLVESFCFDPDRLESDLG